MSSNNGLRWQTNTLINRLTDHIDKLKKMDAELLHVSCVNCDNWVEASETCGKYRQRPPAKIIAFGCQDWSNIDDDVPF